MYKARCGCGTPGRERILGVNSPTEAEGTPPSSRSPPGVVDRDAETSIGTAVCRASCPQARVDRGARSRGTRSHGVEPRPGTRGRRFAFGVGCAHSDSVSRDELNPGACRVQRFALCGVV